MVDTRAPNIILIIGDDLAYPDHGFTGNTVVSTPNLDHLARGGTVFTTGYVTASVCNPSLYSLLTGHEPFRRDGRHVSRYPRRSTLPELLGRHGYASLQTGKFWQKDFASAGFSEGTKGKKLEGTSVRKWMGGKEGLKVGRTTMEPVFDFIARHEDEPFFIWFAPQLPHRPWDAPHKYKQAYRLRDPPLLADTMAYYGNITWFDDAVGKLVAYLDAKGLRSNTLLLYVSDNGYGPRPEQEFEVGTWKGAKGTTTELGFRTPILFNWPGHVPAGVVRDDLVSTLDLFPTTLSFAGAPPPTDRPGIDLTGALAGERHPRDEIVGVVAQVHVVDPQNLPRSDKTKAYFLRNQRWHYVWAPRLDTELLFDIVADPLERQNVAAEFPEVVDELRDRVKLWRNRSPRGAARRTPD